MGKEDVELKKVLRSTLLVPFLFAIYPVLFLYAGNVDQTSFTSVLKPAAIILGVTAVMVIAARLATRSGLKASLLVSVLLVLFFSYGRVVDLAVPVLRPYVRVGLVTFPVWLVLAVAAVVAICRTKRSLEGVGAFARFMAVVLLLVSLVPVVRFLAATDRGTERAWQAYVDRTVAEAPLSAPKGHPLPDIYYIILDAYSRGDVLANVYGFDNSQFLDFLSRSGFYVAAKSNANYTNTQRSLPSSLNFDYLHTLAEESGLPPGGRNHMHMLPKTKAVEMLRRLGYKIVLIPSAFGTVRVARPDLTLSKGSVVSTEFDSVLLQSTVLRAIFHPSQRISLLGALEHLETVPQITGPTFTFAHITMTHAPFYFKADGSKPLDPSLTSETAHPTFEVYREGYVGAISYTNRRVQAVISKILVKSEVSPLIIVQGDHGGRYDGPILNAYHLPDGGDKHLYPSISPVNTFRVVLNHYFGGDYELLEDRTHSPQGGKGR